MATVAFFVVCASVVSGAIWTVGRLRPPNVVSLVLLPMATILLLADLVRRSVEISFVAITNTYEALVFFAVCLGAVLTYLGFRSLRRRSDANDDSTDEARTSFASRYVIFAGSLVLLLLVALASSPLVPDTIRPPVPALRSNWLVLHVSLSFVGEAFFAVSFVASVIQLITRDETRRAELERLTFRSIVIGYPIFTVGALILGAVWAQFAWGRYWGWDPKETWALITWLTYSVYFHFRLFRRRRGAVLAWVSVVGFLFTLFTFFGVNYLLSGLHSYG